MNPGRFDLGSLRLYVASVDGGSLTAGARAFAISLAAASKRIAELEAAAGVLLLERGKGGVRPTSAGQTLYRHAVQVCADVSQLALAMADYGRGVRGHVRIWANTSAVTGFLPAVLSEFLAAHPEVAVDLEEVNSEPTVRALETGAAELGVFADNVAVGALETATCDLDRLVLVAPPGHALARLRAVAFADVLAHDFIGLGRGSALMRQFATAAQAAGGTLRLRVQVNSFDATCRMVAAGIGVGVLPRSAAAAHVASMRLRMVPLRDPWAARRMLVGWRSARTLDRPARLLLERLLARGRALSPVAARELPQPSAQAGGRTPVHRLGSERTRPGFSDDDPSKLRS